MANLYENRLKIYPNGTSEHVTFKSGLTTTTAHKNRNASTKKKTNAQLRLEDAMYLQRKDDDLTELQKLSRRKVRVKDYVLSKNFTMFGTLTMPPTNGFKDLDEDFRHRMILFTRMLRRRGIRYYIVAERHTGSGLNNGYIHLHALFSDNLVTERSRKHSKYLSTPLWTHGYSSVSRIRDYVGTAHYVTKYVTKEALDGKSVWVSQGLIRPQVLYNTPDLLTPIVSEWENDNIKITLRGS